ncbi:hypothetical protein PVK06_043720 [Gossypium arboreum]|uniref:Uncharacterized protein n=1 Tax=Gossypium arboreum TaxID=29729 RepID=A0ABR0MPC9_GOSAR|nr:hypothetical protein PVK06_043720 [Gossypium arboreum]
MPQSPDEQFVAVSHVIVSDINIGYEDIVNTQAFAHIWKVKPSPMPDSWKLKEIFATDIVLDTYLAFMIVAFIWVANYSDFFSDKPGVKRRHWGAIPAAA